MAKQSVFTMKLEQELRDQFMAAAEATHRPASQIVRELMREFIQRRGTATTGNPSDAAGSVQPEASPQ